VKQQVLNISLYELFVVHIECNRTALVFSCHIQVGFDFGSETLVTYKSHTVMRIVEQLLSVLLIPIKCLLSMLYPIGKPVYN